jgi:N,N-dimethylformamidase
VRIVGYSDVWSVAPGDRIQFMVSTVHPSFDASIVRLFHGDPKPDGPGRKLRPVTTSVDGRYEGIEQSYPLGSYATVDHEPALDVDGPFAVSAWLCPTTPGSGPQAIVSKWNEDELRGFGLFLEAEGDLGLRLDGETFRTGAPLRAFAWTFVSAAFDGERVRLEQRPLRRFPGDPSEVAVEEEATAGPSPNGEPLLLGARLNGKLDAPRLERGGAVVAAWDFSLDIGSDRVRDVSGNGHDVRLVNMPMRAVTGHNWTGREVDWRNAPEEYGAVFFHDDDLEDAGWEPSFELIVPDDLASGVYAAWLRAADDEEWIPFFVRPPRGESRSPIAFLAPTLSYLAYANEHAAEGNPVAVTDFVLSDYYQPEDHLAIDVPLLGLYDKHRDGVGCCYSSRLRPVVNMRPHYHLPLIRSAHQFPADLHLVDWLEEKNFEVDVVTDEDLHDEGLELLRRYRVVVTGSHPEYWTTRMLESLARYLEQGGRVMYLGGNGFYWVTSIDPERPHVVEVRRGRRGTGTWRGEPGEDFHSTTGEPGGLWRDRGFPPQRLVGVGMATQGFDRAVPFEREPAADDPRAAWIFDGVPEGPIGDTGLVMGGAAGLEVDRFDHALGTPPHALLLATARGFSDSYQHVVEEVASSDSQQGGTVSPFVRGDMTFFELPDGGAVFSASSISWCGSLSHNGYDNAVSRITENVLRRFAAPEPIGGEPVRDEAVVP